MESTEQSLNQPTKKNNGGRNIIIALSVLAVLMAAGIGYLVYSLVQHEDERAQMEQKNAELKQLQELAELDKQEMQDQYREFDRQYSELQSQLSNDSLVAQIEAERRHTQQLLEELERTKATDANEIMRLKKEIATLRNLLKHYISQVDSLNKLNIALVDENAQIKQQVHDRDTQINSLSSERNQLRDKVDIAAQLDATAFWVTPLNKKSKSTDKVKDVKKLSFGCTVVKNVTATNGQRTLYVRILKPDNSVMGARGSFEYENTSVQYTEKKVIDYTGEEIKVTMYADIDEYLEAGTYKLYMFCDKQMIGQTSFSLK